MGAPLVPLETVRARGGMVASADHLATGAGVAMLRAGGSAVDAAVATNAVLAVTAPNLCGMGGDLFALVYDGAAPPVALNASGRAGSGADPSRLRAEGHAVMPMRRDVRSVTVPGCVDGWLALHARFGRLPLGDVLSPAVIYAERGFPASPLLVASVNMLPAPLPPGAADYAGLVRTGQAVRRPGAARTLLAIARDGRGGFYGGEFGDGLVRVGAGEFTADDLAAPLADWVEPLVGRAWGTDVWTVPPNSQGYLTLASVRLAAETGLPADADDGAWVTRLVEAAVATGRARPDVLFDRADGRQLLDRASVRGGSGLDSPGRRQPAPDTTYLCTVDADGMGVSLIQSNAAGFGSHLFEPTTGINLHNRGIGFSLEAGHPAEYGPGRRPPHTLSPALVTRPDGTLYAVLGTQGGDGQPQILLQVLAHLLAGGQSVAAAVGRHRFVLTGSGQGFDTWTTPGGPTVLVEEGAPEAWVPALEQEGWVVRSGPAFGHEFGHANVIVRDPDGLLYAAADPRARIGSAAGV